jgi:protein-histidine pros-kinase
VAATLRPQADDKGLEFTVQAPDRPAVLRTDRRALSQIVLNLVGNAIKFTERGSVRLSLIWNATGGGVEIRIDDSGVGIPLADQDKLFGAFTRVNSERAGAPEGTGLGLHLSQKLAELLGGKIVFSSESGTGSTFSLILPGL